MSPEIGASKAFIERRGGPAYDWDQTTLTIDTQLHSLDLSAIVPSNATYIKFHLIVTGGTAVKTFLLRDRFPSSSPAFSSTLVTGSDGIINYEFFIKPGAPQTLGYLIQAGITAFTLRVLGWIL